MRLIKYSGFIVGILVLLITLPSCGGKEEAKKEPKRVVKKVVKKHKKKEAVAETAVVEKEEFTRYTGLKLRDPFVPFIKEEVLPIAKAKRALTPLERFDLGELKVVGIMVKGKESFALVEDSEGKGYMVKVGTKIGKNSGTVVKITDDTLVIREEFLDLSGKRVKREKTLSLPKPGGE